MGIDSAYEIKKKPFNRSWKHYVAQRNVTVRKDRVFTPDTKFFTIGSCFANELRDALDRKGFDAAPRPSPAIQHLFPDELKNPSAWGPWDDLAHLQFYNTESILQEFEKAFGLWTQAEDDYLLTQIDGRDAYWDPYRRWLYARTPEDLARIVRAQDAAMRDGILQSDAAILTLGMTEVFRRKKPTTRKKRLFGREQRRMVICQYNKYFRDEAEFEILDYERNYRNIKKVCDLYFGAFPHKRIVLSVSPIPLSATFREQDVVVANTESKSILRAVAGKIAQEYPGVAYWPSYEVCMNSPGSFREDDLRHVSRARVDSIMDAFIHCKMNLPRSAEEEEKRYF